MASVSAELKPPNTLNGFPAHRGALAAALLEATTPQELHRIKPWEGQRMQEGLFTPRKQGMSTPFASYKQAAWGRWSEQEAGNPKGLFILHHLPLPCAGKSKPPLASSQPGGALLPLSSPSCHKHLLIALLTHAASHLPSARHGPDADHHERDGGTDVHPALVHPTQGQVTAVT